MALPHDKPVLGALPYGLLLPLSRKIASLQLCTEEKVGTALPSSTISDQQANVICECERNWKQTMPACRLLGPVTVSIGTS